MVWFFIVGMLIFIALMCFVSKMMRDVSKYSKQTIKSLKEADLCWLECRLLKLQTAWAREENRRFAETENRKKNTSINENPL